MSLVLSSELTIPGQTLTPTQQNVENATRLDQQVTELLVSTFDPGEGKTIWQCAQCHFSSKVRFNVKRHIETHIENFAHQCPHCDRTSKTRNALQAHIMRSHTGRPQTLVQQQEHLGLELEPGASEDFEEGPDKSPEGIIQLMETKPARRRPQKRPWDEELERQIRVLLISNYDPVECKTTWSCAQCKYSSKIQYTVKQHIETHISTIVHQCTECPKILKTRNALRVHMIQKHEFNPVQAPSPQLSFQSPRLHPQTPTPQRRRRSNIQRAPPSAMDIELDRQVAELMVSNYDSVLGRTTWQCAQCHFSSKVRSTVKEHIETHISGFSHPCPMCQKTCKTRNALRVHKIQAHKNKNQAMPHQLQLCQNPQQQQPQQPQRQPQDQQQEEANQAMLQPLLLNQASEDGHQPMIAKKTVLPQPHQQEEQLDQKPSGLYHHPEHLGQVDLHNKELHQHQQELNLHQKELNHQQKLLEPVRAQGIMNHPMVGRPMYGHPMMIGHPML